MCAQGPTHADRLVGELADRQHGVVSRGQLLRAGLTRHRINHRVRTGRLRPMFRGVYAVGHVALRREGWWMGALLACGERAALSHRSAGQLWAFLGAESILPVDVITGGDRGRKIDALIAHRTPLHPDEVLVRDGLRVTAPSRTLVDLGGVLGGRAMRQAVERAQDVRRFDPGDIRAVIRRAPRRPGSRALVDLLDLIQPDKDNARSHLERLFLPVVRRARLPRPSVNFVIGSHERDFVWPTARLVVETDGYAFHSTREAARRDRRRDRELIALGWRPARFTYEEVAFEPADVGRELAGLISQAPYICAP